MAEEIGFENGRNSNFDGLVTLTLDPVIRHIVVHHSSTSTYIPNFIEIEETFVDGRTDVFPPLILLGRLLEVDLIISNMSVIICSKIQSPLQWYGMVQYSLTSHSTQYRSFRRRGALSSDVHILFSNGGPAT